MHYRVAGTVSGDQNNGNTILTAGDVNVTGTAEFAVSKYDRDLGTITDATLNSYAFNLQGGFSVGTEIDMNLAGAIAVVTVNDNADNAIYTAIKVQDANVTASTGTDTFGLDGQLDITNMLPMDTTDSTGPTPLKVRQQQCCRWIRTDSTGPTPLKDGVIWNSRICRQPTSQHRRTSTSISQATCTTVSLVPSLDGQDITKYDSNV